METEKRLNRRQFLRISAMTAAGTVVVACSSQPPSQQAGVTAAPGGTTAPVVTSAPSNAATTSAPETAATSAPVATEASAATTTAPEATASATDTTATTAPMTDATSAPIAVPTTFGESPSLTEQVKAGKLPPVEERLPKTPYVVPHKWVTPGKYGGTMQWSTASTWGLGHYIQESMYGHSPLRFLRDGLEIGPGLAEQWENSDDFKTWTLHFREGLKWSDGQPWTVEDILYWWNDMVNNSEYADEANLPDDFRSGSGKPAQLKKVDDFTLQIIFDVPSPVFGDRAATWVKCGIGPRWMAPSHYLKQYHPKYNKAVKDYKDHGAKMDFTSNPDCPTMTGWHLTEYVAGQRTIWERNPYYWVVDKQGNQLPYIDHIYVTGFQDNEVEKIAIMAGKVDYVHGGFGSVDLQDIALLNQAKDQSKLELLLWDSGSGTGSIFFFNYDYKDEKMRTLIREPKFRQALSLAFNRQEVLKSIYFNRGELTTGTYSPKSIEYLVNDEGKKVYAQWRDSFVKYDPEQAKQLLDGIGVKMGADGKRTMPDGSPLKISLDYHADTGKEHIRKNEFLTRDWQAIGVDTTMNPVPPSAVDGPWSSGTLMSKTDWEASDGPNHLDNPTWLVPIEVSRWAPLEGQYYSVRGTPKEGEEKDVDPYERKPPRLEPEPGGPIERMWKLYDQAKVETDTMKRYKMVWDIIKIHAEEGPFYMGVVANYPRITLVKEGLKNVPRREDLALGGYVNTWIHPTPSAYDPEAYYWDNPEQHS